MRKVVVIDTPHVLPGLPDDVETVSPKTYLSDTEWGKIPKVMVFNLSRKLRYQARGYYVSLLAEARGHRCLPSVKTIQDMKSNEISQIISIDIDVLIQKSLSRLKSSEFVLSIYFARNIAKQHDKLAQALYELFPAPLLRAKFIKNRKWVMKSIKPIGLKDVPEHHLEYMNEAAAKYFTKRHRDKRKKYKYDLAVLVNPVEKSPPLQCSCP